jgi:hypothetical protein
MRSGAYLQLLLYCVITYILTEVLRAAVNTDRKSHIVYRKKFSAVESAWAGRSAWTVCIPDETGPNGKDGSDLVKIHSGRGGRELLGKRDRM